MVNRQIQVIALSMLGAVACAAIAGIDEPTDRIDGPGDVEDASPAVDAHAPDASHEGGAASDGGKGDGSSGDATADAGPNGGDDASDGAALDDAPADGSTPDASPDGAPIDAGQDTSPPVDAGHDSAPPFDAGHDAGPPPPVDAGFDAAGCPLGGGPSGCFQLVPSGGGALPGDVTATDVQAFSAPAGDTIVNTDIGTITNGGTTLRNPNGDIGTRSVDHGIAYVQRNGVAVFGFQGLSVPVGSTLKLVGTRPVALVSSSYITVDGLVDATPMDSTGARCAPLSAGPGAGAGGKDQAGGMGPGAGGPGSGFYSHGQGNQVGGGGAGNAGEGGNNAWTLAKGALVPLDLSLLKGGSGGGGGADYETIITAEPGGYGGGGGGGVQLVAGGTITIGSGTASGGLNAGACGGAASLLSGDAGFGTGQGGGGGSGGMILLEARTIQLLTHGVLAANGAGGACSDAPGQSATFNSLIAYGGYSSSLVLQGGNGGAAGSAPGTDAEPTKAPVGGPGGFTDPGQTGCGGGGSAGYIRVNTLSGTPTLSGTAIVTPTTASGATSYGKITLQ